MCSLLLAFKTSSLLPSQVIAVLVERVEHQVMGAEGCKHVADVSAGKGHGLRRARCWMRWVEVK